MQVSFIYVLVWFSCFHEEVAASGNGQQKAKNKENDQAIESALLNANVVVRDWFILLT